MTTEKPVRKRRGKFAMPAKEGAKLAKLFGQLMAELGARSTPGGWFDYELDTPLGMLGIHDIDTEYCHIFMRFENPALAAYHMGVGPNCGKWNWHFGRDWEAEDVMQLFTARLRLALAAKPEYRGCAITPESSERPIYFGDGLTGADWIGYSRQFVRVIFPDLTWVRCCNPEEARRYIDGPNGIAAHASKP